MAETSSEKLVLTEAEKKNGWTPETLKKYLDEREVQRQNYTARAARKRVQVQNTQSYNPYRW